MCGTGRHPVARPYRHHSPQVQNCSTLRSTIHKCWSRGHRASRTEFRDRLRRASRARASTGHDRVQVFAVFTEPNANRVRSLSRALPGQRWHRRHSRSRSRHAIRFLVDVTPTVRTDESGTSILFGLFRHRRETPFAKRHLSRYAADILSRATRSHAGTRHGIRGSSNGYAKVAQRPDCATSRPAKPCFSRHHFGRYPGNTPDWRSDGAHEKREIPRELLETAKRKKESVREPLHKTFLRRCSNGSNIGSLGRCSQRKASVAFVRSNPTVTLKINRPPSERRSENITTFTGLKKLSRERHSLFSPRRFANLHISGTRVDGSLPRDVLRMKIVTKTLLGQPHQMRRMHSTRDK